LFKSGGDVGDVKQKPYVHQLELKLKSFQLMDQVLAGLSNLSIPEIKTIDFLRSIVKTLDSDTLSDDGKILTLKKDATKFEEEEFKPNSVESVGGNVHWTFFKKFSSKLDKVIKLCKTGKIEASLKSEAKTLAVFFDNILRNR